MDLDRSAVVMSSRFSSTSLPSAANGAAPAMAESAQPTAPPFAGTSRAYGWSEVYAALDLGTNNCRLLVARGTDQGFRVVDAFSRIVRLGEGVNATGLLSEAAMERTLDALKVCAAKIAHRGVTRARYVATEA